MKQGSVLGWRRRRISSLSNIRVHGSCSYVRALRTLSMGTRIRTEVMVPWARVPTNSVKRSFGSENDYGKKAKTNSDYHGCNSHVFVRQLTPVVLVAFLLVFKHTLLYYTVLFHIGFTIKMGISGPIGIYFQHAYGRFFCPLPLPSLRCVVLDADSDDSAPLASWASTALSTAWRRTFSGIWSQ
jgi:hypothetical protein